MNHPRTGALQKWTNSKIALLWKLAEYLVCAGVYKFVYAHQQLAYFWGFLTAFYPIKWKPSFQRIFLPTYHKNICCFYKWLNYFQMPVCTLLRTKCGHYWPDIYITFRESDELFISQLTGSFIQFQSSKGVFERFLFLCSLFVHLTTFKMQIILIPRCMCSVSNA